MTFTKDAIIGFVVLAIVIIGLIWYVAAHPAPSGSPYGTTATGTPDTGEIQQKGDTYAIDLKYPVTTPLAQTAGASADAAAVTMMKSYLTESILPDFEQSVQANDQTIAQFKAQGQDVPASFTGLSLASAYEEHESPTTVSYIIRVDEFTGGAHPNSTYQTFTYDKSTGRLLSLGDLFTGTTYLSTLSQIARQALPSQIAAAENVDTSQIDMNMVASGTEPTAANFGAFYLDGGNLVLIFPPYAVGPYVLGTVTLPIPLASLQGINTKYTGS